MRQLLILILTLSLPLCAQPLKVQVQSKSAILINADTGSVLFEKNADLLSYPGSTTKIATLLYLLEGKKIDLKGSVSVSNEAVASVHASVKQAAFDRHPAYRLEHDGTLMGLRRGDIVDVHTMLHGLMLMSGNDAANALAEHCSGTVDQFCQEMDAFLKGLGLKQTRMTNPHGLHHPEHVTTARDFALLTARAVKNPLFRRIVNTINYESPSGLTMVQHNKLLRKGAYYYPKAFGVKTGYHARAGFTLVAAAEDQGRTLIAVVFGGATKDERYKDAIALFDTAFKEKKQKRTLLAKESESFSIELPRAKGPVRAQLLEDISLEYFPSEEPKVRAELQWKKLSAPIEANQLVGCVKILDDGGRVIQAAPLYSIQSVPVAFVYGALSVMKWVLLALCLLLIKPLREKLKLLKTQLLGSRLRGKTD